MLAVWIGLALVPLGVQALALFVDEFVMHYRRSLPRWERLGHPMDTCSVLGAIAFPVFSNFGSMSLLGFICVAFFSSFLVTKDEWVHARNCSGLEHWLHAVLFVCHPMTFVSLAFFWALRDQPLWLQSEASVAGFAEHLIQGQFILLILFLSYQIIYWNFVRPKAFDEDADSRLQAKQSVSLGPQ